MFWNGGWGTPLQLLWTQNFSTKTWMSCDHLYHRHNWYGQKQMSLASTVWLWFNSLHD
jgi:hypothetical protein